MTVEVIYPQFPLFGESREDERLDFGKYQSRLVIYEARNIREESERFSRMKFLLLEGVGRIGKPLIRETTFEMCIRRGVSVREVGKI